MSILAANEDLIDETTAAAIDEGNEESGGSKDIYENTAVNLYLRQSKLVNNTVVTRS